MDFKFRAIDQEASKHHPTSSGISYFTEQARRVEYHGNFHESMNLELEKERIMAERSNYGGNSPFFRNPNHVNEMVKREMEKERIRAEIMSGELTRRHMLEAEVRRELMMEREMEFIHSGSSSASAMWLKPRVSNLSPSEDRLFEERLAMSMVGNWRHNLIEGCQTLPFQRNVEPKISEVNPLMEISKENTISLANFDGNISGLKRKAVTTLPAAPGGNDLPLVCSNKKAKEEWSCALCRVIATSEDALNEHLQGKKHKSKEAGLKTGKNFTIGLLSPIKQEDTNKSKNQELPQINCVAVKTAKGTIGTANTEENKKKLKFWCDMCKVGAHSQKVINNHKKGKKHKARLERLNSKIPEPVENEKCEEVVGKDMEKSEEVVAKDMEKCEEVVAKDEKEEIVSVDVDGDAGAL